MEGFLRELADLVARLAETAITLDNVASPEFSETLLRAVEIARMTKSREKWRWISAGVISAARVSNRQLSDMRNLRIVDQLAPIHIEVLQFLGNPGPYLAGWRRELPVNWPERDEQVLLDILPYFDALEDVVQVMTDLHEAQLVSAVSRRDYPVVTDDGHGMPTLTPYFLPPLSVRGQEFLKFIQEPPEVDVIGR